MVNVDTEVEVAYLDGTLSTFIIELVEVDVIRVELEHSNLVMVVNDESYALLSQLDSPFNEEQVH